MPGTYSTVPSVATGDWITAGWVNTYIGGNLAALWPYLSAGDIAYALDADELSRLALTPGGLLFGAASAPQYGTAAGGTAGKILRSTTGNAYTWVEKGSAYESLRMDSSGNVQEYGQPPFVTASLYNATSYSYNSDTERDVPNSSGTITLLVQSTIIMIARLYAANGVGNCIGSFRTSIDGTVGNFAFYSYGDGIGIPLVCMGIKTGVAAGARTLKLREKEAYGAGVSYAVDHKEWIAVAIPETI